MSKREPEIQDVPEDEEIDFDDDDDMDDGVDLLEALGQMFTTDDGETVASALVGLKNATEMQNKILIKILSVLSTKPAASVVTTPA